MVAAVRWRPRAVAVMAGPVKFYLAGAWSRRAELAGHSSWLQSMGWESTASWLTQTDTSPPCPDCGGEPKLGYHCQTCGGSGNLDQRDPRAGKWAAQDLNDIDRADCLILFTDQVGAPGSGRGGRFVEFGYAIAQTMSRGLICGVVGPPENIFTHLVLRFDDIADAYRVIDQRVKR